MAELLVGQNQKDSCLGAMIHPAGTVLDPAFRATKGPTPTAAIVQIAVMDICPQPSVVAAAEIMIK
jgi:hypothetical protein